MPDITYQRQTELHLTVPSSVTVAGIGGIGSWVAILAAMTGIQSLYLFDPDTLEEHNRNRLPFCQGSLNRPKVEVTREFIMALRPDAIVVAIQEKLEGVLLNIQLSLGGCIIDCTDSPKAQFTIYNACKAQGSMYIRAGYDGTHITVTSAVSGWIKTDSEEENYDVRPSWVVPAVTVAALAVGKLTKFQLQEVNLDISEIGVPAARRRQRLTARCTQPAPRHVVGGGHRQTQPPPQTRREARGGTTAPHTFREAQAYVVGDRHIGAGGIPADQIRAGEVGEVLHIRPRTIIADPIAVDGETHRILRDRVRDQEEGVPMTFLPDEGRITTGEQRRRRWR